MNASVHSVLLCLALAAPVSAQSSPDLQTAGQVVVTASGRVQPTNVWADILKGAITLPAGGFLYATVDVAGGFAAGSGCVMRMLVDDQPAGPTVAVFRDAPASRNAVHDFVAPAALPAGTHRVSIQVAMSAGSGTISDRSMVLRFTTADSEWARQAYIGLAGSVRRAAGGYADISGLTVDVDCPVGSLLEISGTGEFTTDAGARIFVRATVDGTPTKNVVMVDGPGIGRRGMTFTAPVAAGRHNVRLQWDAGANAAVHQPALRVLAIPAAGTAESACVHVSPADGGPYYTSSTQFVGIPGIPRTRLWVPGRSDVTVRFSAEAGATSNGYFRLRCTLDNVAAPLGGDRSWFYGRGTLLTAATESLFVFRNVAPGWHDVELQWATTSGATLAIGDRTLCATAILAQQPLLVTATESNRPAGYPLGGLFSSAVVETVNGKRRFRPYVGANLFRAAPGVADWFAEQARGRHHVVEAALIGPNLKLFDEQTYRSLPNWPTAMKTEALMYADLDFDFSYYDRDGDTIVRTDELYATVVMYQDTSFGEVRTLPAIGTRDGVTLDYSQGGLATCYLADFTPRGWLGLIAHELCHLLIGAGDMYEANDPTRPGSWSLMDWHGGFGHLDPLHKIAAGQWLAPTEPPADGWVELDPVELGGEVLRLRDPNSHYGEFFLVENRGLAGHYNSGNYGAGLVVWHCDETRLPNWRTAVELEPSAGLAGRKSDYDCPFTGLQPGFHVRKDFWHGGTPIDSRWHDLTPSRIGLWGIEPVEPGSTRMRVFVDVPGPGVLVQLEKRTVAVDGHGDAYLQVRVVNTEVVPDLFSVQVSLAGQASWTLRTLRMQGYESAILPLVVRVDPRGTREVTITATGAGSGAKTSDTARVLFPLEATGSGAIGTDVRFDLSHPDYAGKWYFLGASLGNTPGTTLPGNVYLPLNADALLFQSMNMPGIFDYFLGKLDGGGNAVAWFRVPPIPALRGVRIFFAFVTYDPGPAFLGASNGVDVVIR